MLVVPKEELWCVDTLALAPMPLKPSQDLLCYRFGIDVNMERSVRTIQSFETSSPQPQPIFLHFLICQNSFIIMRLGKRSRFSVSMDQPALRNLS